MTSRFVAPCEVKPGDKPVPNNRSGYTCHYMACGRFIEQGEWTVKGREVGDDGPYQTVHAAHTPAVDDLAGVKRSMWLEVPDVYVSGDVNAAVLIESHVTPTYSAPMSENEAIEHARRGEWIVCITPDQKRNRRYVVAMK
jgi:hypothetical protein